ncbi:hypothetical protein ACFVMC_17425 [Nocardia sp. NPDC127579]
MLTFLLLATVIVALGVVASGRSTADDHTARRAQDDLTVLRAYSGGTLLS